MVACTVLTRPHTVDHTQPTRPARRRRHRSPLNHSLDRTYMMRSYRRPPVVYLYAALLLYYLAYTRAIASVKV